MIDKIKEENSDIAKENKAKYRFAKEHFDRLNKNKKQKHNTFSHI